MRKRAALKIGLIWLLLLSAELMAARRDKRERVLTLVTTTSTENSGLLKKINPLFERKANALVKVIAMGTGAAIRTAQQGNADVILVHARSREDQFVAQGYGIGRKDVMYNDFVIIGPVSDPAKIKGIEDVTWALKKIAHGKATFVSRGDDSGTHIKEQFLWRKTRLPLVGKKTVRPKDKGSWYYSLGQGMGNTIVFAYEKQGYTLADRGTFLAYRNKLDLKVLNEGDERLFNPYGIIAVNPKKHPGVKYDLAMEYINWITSDKVQKIIGNYKVNGEVLFHPNAKKR